MKHKLSITLLLLAMFLATQFIGLYVVDKYSPVNKTVIDAKTGKLVNISVEQELPFGLQPKQTEPNLFSIIFSFALAFFVIFLLMEYKWKVVIKIWFFFVVLLALAITFNAVFKDNFENASIIALAVALPLTYFKVVKPHVVIHNLTELLIYPGIAAVFVAFLSPISVVILLILISFYDMWAVWRSKVMQKMAKFQMEELHLFGGFLIPSVSDKVKKEIKKIKEKYKNKKMPEKIKSKKFKVNLAILGGGDVIFPIITAGVFMRAFGLTSALCVIGGALAGLSFLFLITKKGKAYPAMPYITVGIFLGLILNKLAFM